MADDSFAALMKQAQDRGTTTGRRLQAGEVAPQLCLDQGPYPGGRRRLGGVLQLRHGGLKGRALGGGDEAVHVPGHLPSLGRQAAQPGQDVG
jgi:hypothetical protein